MDLWMRQEKGNSKEVSEKFEKYIDFWNIFDLNVESFFFSNLKRSKKLDEKVQSWIYLIKQILIGYFK